VVRVAGLGLLAFSLLRWIARPRLSAPSVPATASLLAIGAWIGAAILSSLAHPPLRFRLFGEIEQREGVLTLLGLAGLHLATRRSHRTPGDVRTTLDLMIVCAALAGAYGLIQFAGHDPLSWANPARYPAGGGLMLRPWGTLGNAILLGAVSSAALAAATARLAVGRADPWRHAPLIALLAVVVTTTLSRGAWLAAAFGAGVALLGAFLSPAAPNHARRIAGCAAAAVLPAALFAALALRDPVGARLAESTHRELGSLGARIEIARGAVDLWRTHPWLGVGPDGFGAAFPLVQSAVFWRGEWLGQPVHAHSVPFQMLATLGIAGILAGTAWLLAAAAGLGHAWRRGPERRPELLAIGAALTALTVGGALNALGLGAAVCFAVLTGLVFASDEPSPTSSPGGRVAALAGIVVAAWATVGAVGELRAHALAGEARNALLESTLVSADARAPLLDRASERAFHAASTAPGDDELWRLACDASLARAEGAITRGDAVAADAALDAEHAALRAERVVPARAANVERVANALAMRARVARLTAAAGATMLADAADSAYAAALRLAPTNALILQEQARSAQMLGRPDRALAAARRITALYPDEGAGHASEAAALIALGRTAEARGALRRALAGHWDESAPDRANVAMLLATLDRSDSLRALEATTGKPASPPASR